MLEIDVALKGNLRVDATVNGFTICTDQVKEKGGDGTAPDAFQYFLASIGACAGYWVAQFCNSREISTEGITLKQRVIPDETGFVDTVELDICLPASFPEKYHAAVLRTANTCMVKRTIENEPEITTQIVVNPD